MPDAQGRLTRDEVRQTLEAEAAREFDGEPASEHELPKKPSQPANFRAAVRAMLDEAPAKPPTAEQRNRQVEAEQAAKRAALEEAGRLLAPDRGRAELKRQLENYERQDGAQKPDAVEKPAASRPDEAGKDWPSVYAGMSAEELDAAQEALIDAQVAVETEHLSPADFAFEPGVETAVVDDDEDEWNNEELASLPAWAPGGSDYDEGDDTE